MGHRHRSQYRELMNPPPFGSLAIKLSHTRSTQPWQDREMAVALRRLMSSATGGAGRFGRVRSAMGFS
jgi:hypothetical protein